MTKRLTPEEDAAAIEGVEREGCGGIRYSYGADEGPIWQLDKRQHEMEITREGERFLEVRFKRRESADAGKVVAFDELVPWPGLRRPVSYAEAAALAQRVLRANGR